MKPAAALGLALASLALRTKVGALFACDERASAAARFFAGPRVTYDVSLWPDGFFFVAIHAGLELPGFGPEVSFAIGAHSPASRLALR